MNLSTYPSVLRLTLTPYSPMVNPECKIPTFRASAKCQRPGLFVEIIKLITDYLNLTIESHVFNSTGYHPEYKRMFDDLNNNRTDLFALLFEKTDYRIGIDMDFSAELYESHRKIAVRRNDHSLKSIFDFFMVYNYTSWICMVLIFLLFTAFGVFVRYLEWRLNLRESWNASSLVFKMIRLQLVQPDPIDYKFLSGSTSLIIFTVFQICIIFGIYQSWVLSSVIKSKEPLPFRPEDLIQVLKDKKYFLVTLSNEDSVLNDIETSYLSPYYEIRNALKDNPVIQIPDLDDALNTIVDKNAITIIPNDQMITFQAEKYCDIVYMSSLIPPNSERFMFRKGSPFIAPFNRAIKDNLVFIQKIYRKYLISRPPSNCTKIDDRPVPLKINPYYGVLILFMIGMSSACFIFSGEIWRFY